MLPSLFTCKRSASRLGQSSFQRVASPRNCYRSVPSADALPIVVRLPSSLQWRQGPLGPKTLCNACGVRYRKEVEILAAREATGAAGQRAAK